LPQFDWWQVLQWSGTEWIPATDKSAKLALRIAIPSRTTRHRQAAVHTLWSTEKEKEMRLYGFRKKDGQWHCTAESDWAADREDVKPVWRRRNLRWLSYS
jgi:hypothetical protein